VTARICIVAPVFRHAESAALLARRLRTFNLPTIFVDDGNGPEDAAVIARISEEHDFVTVIRREVNGGKGAAVLAGLCAAAAAGYTHALQIDSDAQHDIADIPRFVEAARAEPETLVAGAPRFDETAPLGRRIGRQLSRVCVWGETLSFDIDDPMCGYRVYPLASTLEAANSGWLGTRMDFDIEILVRLHWLGVPFRSIPTDIVYPEGGISNFRLFGDNWRISAMHTRLLLGMVIRLTTGRLALRRGMA
jgi:glycosyltransferase involved in cell wall biosynthesis